MKNWSDIEVFKAIKGGDQEALSILFLRYHTYLLHYGKRITPRTSIVEECIQELFIYIFESHQKLGEIKFVKAYLFRALRRRILEKIKKERRLRHHEITARELVNISFSAGDILLQKEDQISLRQTLTDTLNALPARQREAIYLRYYNQLSTREIAEVMEVADQTILNTLHQALKKIRKSETLLRLFKGQTR